MESIKNFIPKIQNPNIKLMLKSIVLGNTKADVYVVQDSSEKANFEQVIAGFVYIPNKTWILLGKKIPTPFIGLIKSKINQEIPDLVNNTSGYYKFYFNSSAGKKIIENDILDSYPSSILANRVCYCIKMNPKTKNHNSFKTRVATYKIRNIEFILITDKNQNILDTYKNGDSVIKEIREISQNISNFFDQFGFGIVAYDSKQTIVGWILSEYHSNETLGIGIEVVSSYRNQGIARELGKMFLKHVKYLSEKREYSINVIWDAWSFNIASLKTAESIGFKNKYTYQAYYGFWKKYKHYLEWAYHLREESEYKKAAKATLEAISHLDEKIPYRIYYLVACNYALAKKQDKALEFLRKSLVQCPTEKMNAFKKHIFQDPDMRSIVKTNKFRHLFL